MRDKLYTTPSMGKNITTDTGGQLNKSNIDSLSITTNVTPPVGRGKDVADDRQGAGASMACVDMVIKGMSDNTNSGIITGQDACSFMRGISNIHNVRGNKGSISHKRWGKVKNGFGWIYSKKIGYSCPMDSRTAGLDSLSSVGGLIQALQPGENKGDFDILGNLPVYVNTSGRDESESESQTRKSD